MMLYCSSSEERKSELFQDGFINQTNSSPLENVSSIELGNSFTRNFDGGYDGNGTTST